MVKETIVAFSNILHFLTLGETLVELMLALVFKLLGDDATVIPSEFSDFALVLSPPYFSLFTLLLCPKKKIVWLHYYNMRIHANVLCKKVNV